MAAHFPGPVTINQQKVLDARAWDLLEGEYLVMCLFFVTVLAF